MDSIKLFLEQQPLLSMFLVIGLGYALGGVNIRGFALGAGAVLFVGLGLGMFAPQASPPALLGSLGLFSQSLQKALVLLCEERRLEVYGVRVQWTLRH